MPLRSKPDRFPRVYNITDFGITANVTFQPSQWATVGTVTVPFGQAVTFGIGGLGTTDSREVCYIRLDATVPTNSPATGGFQIQGKIRLSLSDPNLIREIVVAENRTERFSASQNDKTIGFLLGEYPTKAFEQSKLIVKCYIDSATAVVFKYDGTDSKMLVPVTVYQ